MDEESKEATCCFCFCAAENGLVVEVLQGDNVQFKFVAHRQCALRTRTKMKLQETPNKGLICLGTGSVASTFEPDRKSAVYSYAVSKTLEGVKVPSGFDMSALTW